MGHEEVAEPHGGAQLVEQVDDAGLDGHVQGGDRLVKDQEAGFEGQGAGNADALTLPAGEVARVAVGVAGLEPDEPHELLDARPDIGLLPPVGPQRLGDDVEDRQARVQGGHGVLEDDLQVAAHLAALGPPQVGRVLAQDHDRALLGPLEGEDLHEGGGLAASGLADQGQGLAPADVEGDAVDGVDGAHASFEDGALHEGELLDEVGDAQDLGALGVRQAHGLGSLERRHGVDVGVVELVPLDLVAAVAGRVLGAGAGLLAVGPVALHEGELRLLLGALGLGHGAAGDEGAPSGQLQQRGRVALEGGQGRVLARVQTGQGAEQADRVGHARAVEDVVDVAGLHDAPRVHDGHPVGHAGHDPQVVGDHDDAGTGLLLGGAQHVEDLGLDGDVESRGGLIGDDEIGVVGDRDGDDGPLAHAAGELVGVGLGTHLRVGDAHQVEQLDGALVGVRLAHLGLVDPQGLDDLGADRVHGGQGAERVLEDHGDLGAADAGHVAVGPPQQLGAVEAHRPGDLGGLVEQAHDRRRGDGLARTGLADQGQHFTAGDGQVDSAHGVDAPVLGGEGDLQVGDLQQRGGAGGVRERVVGASGVDGGNGRGALRGLGGRAGAARGSHALPPDLDEGSMASRRPSPMTLTHRSMRTSTAAGARKIQG